MMLGLVILTRRVTRNHSSGVLANTPSMVGAASPPPCHTGAVTLSATLTRRGIPCPAREDGAGEAVVTRVQFLLLPPCLERAHALPLPCLDEAVVLSHQVANRNWGDIVRSKQSRQPSLGNNSPQTQTVNEARNPSPSNDKQRKQSSDNLPENRGEARN
uniref:Uncharacterized protein n=1 Tax=Cacopsylla melanoneura TaxID=428564 RepID=A0A8D8RL56_9HEMI